MLANVLEIEERSRPYDIDIAALSNFRFRAAGTTDARALVDRPEVTLYCLDDEQHEAVFVETPPDADLRQYSFYYQGQFRNALRLLTVSYETLHELADYAGSRFQKLILTYSVGRCGSTLLSRALNRVDSVLDLSEPEVYMQITAMRPRDCSRDEELKRLLESCTRLLYKPAGPQTTLAVKFRSFSIEIADLLYQLYPRAKVLFLYRNAETWAQSQAQAFDIFSDKSKEMVRKTLEENPQFLRRTIPLLPDFMKRHLRRHLGLKDYVALLGLALASRMPPLRGRVKTPAQYLEPYLRSFPSVKLMAVQWLSAMDRYLELSGRGIPMLAVRYENLVAAPRQVLEAIFDFCGLPREQLAAAEAVFAEDSQQGTTLARGAKADRAALTAADLSEVRETLREHPVIQQADFIVPNTVTV